MKTIISLLRSIIEVLKGGIGNKSIKLKVAPLDATMQVAANINKSTKAEFAEALGITEDQVDQLLQGKVDYIEYTIDGTTYTLRSSLIQSMNDGVGTLYDVAYYFALNTTLIATEFNWEEGYSYEMKNNVYTLTKA